MGDKNTDFQIFYALPLHITDSYRKNSRKKSVAYALSKALFA
jgi:hypothetical protein